MRPQTPNPTIVKYSHNAQKQVEQEDHSTHLKRRQLESPLRDDQGLTIKTKRTRPYKCWALLTEEQMACVALKKGLNMSSDISIPVKASLK